MEDAQVLLEKIASLRQRLEQVRGLVHQAGSAIACMAGEGAEPTDRVQTLRRNVRLLGGQGGLLDDSLRRWEGSAEGECLPAHWTARARRLLERGRDLLRQEQALADAFGMAGQLGRATGAVVAPGSGAEGDPLAEAFGEAVAMTHATVRLMAALPSSPSGQLSLCPGLEGIFDGIAQRVDALTEAVAIRRKHAARLDALAELLADLEEGKAVEGRRVLALAEALVAEAREGAPLRFPARLLREPARFAAAHGLATAQVAAQLVSAEAASADLVAAALVHDVGMIRAPAETFTGPGPLADALVRRIEAHAHEGAELAAKLLPSQAWLAQAVAAHHERLDGTGYPAGLRGAEIAPLARLLAACDVYAAQCAPRPHRPAKDTRTALTDTLLMADGGALGREEADRLLVLSFYPVGTVVELSDGAVGVVVAPPTTADGMESRTRPVLSVLTDARQRPLAAPAFVDLARCEGRTVVRCLPAARRDDLLGKHFPALAAWTL